MFFLIACYAAIARPHADYMQTKAYIEQVATAPRGDILRLITADFKQLVAATYIMNVLTYFGGRSALASRDIQVPVNYRDMSLTLNAALKLDPYNMDAYYFAQAILVWDTRQFTLANQFLEYGMRYRTWDYYLPFFAGFNYSYFLKDYAKAAHYFARAEELSGNPLFAQLAGRYLHESGQTDHAIMYLSVMEKNARNDSVKKSFAVRLDAMKKVKLIETARDRYAERYGRLPDSVNQLVNTGFLSTKPADPYGGEFYLEKDGQVQTTSKFAFAGTAKRKTP